MSAAKTDEAMKLLENSEVCIAEGRRALEKLIAHCAANLNTGNGGAAQTFVELAASAVEAFDVSQGDLTKAITILEASAAKEAA